MGPLRCGAPPQGLGNFSMSNLFVDVVGSGQIGRPRRLPGGEADASHISKAGGLISTARLRLLLALHLPPIEVVVFHQTLGESLSWSVLRA